MDAAQLSPQFRFVSDHANTICTLAKLQMVRRVDSAGVFSWRAPKADVCLFDLMDWAHEHGGRLLTLDVTAYRGGYRHTITVG